MDKQNIREDIIYFSITFFIIITLGMFFLDLYNVHVCHMFSEIFLPFIPTLIFIRKGKIYSIVFSLYVLEFYMMCLGIVRPELMLMSEINCDWRSAWEFIFLITSMGFYFGLKIIIKEYLNYRKLDYEEKIVQKSFKEILKRVSYFFISLLSLLLIYNILSWINIEQFNYDWID